MKLTKSKLKQIIREAVEGQFMDEDERFTIHDLKDVPAQLERVLTIMKGGNYNAAARRIRDIKGVVEAIVEAYYAREYDKG